MVILDDQTLFFVQMIQQNGNREHLKNGPPEAWLGFSLLPEGNTKLFPPSQIFLSGAEIKFPLLFTADLNFDLEPFLFSADKGIGTMPAENTCVGSTMEN